MNKIETVQGTDTAVSPRTPDSWSETLAPVRRPRRARKALAVVLVALVLGGAGVVAWWRLNDKQPAATTPKAVTTTPILRETLTEKVVVAGRLDYGAPAPVTAPGSGMVTWLPSVGAPVRRGQALLRVDDQPVVLLYGEIPMYRPLAEGTEGRDVEQFEVNLRALGYRGFTVDEEYTASTAEAVKRWQRWMGTLESGSIVPGAVVYLHSPIRVAAHLARPGSPAGGDVLTYTGQRRRVVVEANAEKASWAKKGLGVRVSLPDGGSAKGKVSKVQATPTEPEAESAASDDAEASAETVTITVDVADQAALRDVELGRIDVSYVAKERKNVLTVPVSALLALAEGGYGLELITGTDRRVVPVEVGLFTAARTEVSGPDLQEGLTVAVPE
ncbi:peptidoglycan-binding protein [Paractinoplanes maris]|uniref:peptidoglycan-binding protein n=1 Tax=Paractinoplanes maris TaxID=1734446 RepID=UPI002021C3C2|nr:peptidoglycan-binding protein [Actinoplanes maris]